MICTILMDASDHIWKIKHLSGKDIMRCPNAQDSEGQIKPKIPLKKLKNSIKPFLSLTKKLQTSET